MIMADCDEYVYITRAYSKRNLESLAFDLMFYSALSSKCKILYLGEICDEKWLYFIESMNILQCNIYKKYIALHILYVVLYI